ncbi:hypothetical protein PAMP_002883 [Pampus punctatissimus]
MASSKKSGGNSRFEKGFNGRRSSKHKEGPVVSAADTERTHLHRYLNHKQERSEEGGLF